MSEIYVHENIKKYISFLKKSCNKIFNSKISESYTSKKHDNQNFVEVVLDIKQGGFFKKDKDVFYLYFCSKNGTLAVNDFIGKQNYIIQKYEEFCAYEKYEEAFIAGRHHLHNEDYEDYKGDVLNFLYKKIFKNKNNSFNQVFNEKEIIKSFSKNNEIKYLGPDFGDQKYSIFRGLIEDRKMFSLNFSVLGNFELEIYLNIKKTEDTWVISGGTAAGKLEYTGNLKKDKSYEQIKTAVEQIISYKEMSKGFKSLHDPEIAFLQIFPNPQDDKKFKDLFDKFVLWSSSKTELPEIDKSIFSRKENKNDLLDANAEVSYLIKELNEKLNQEKVLMEDFLNFWKSYKYISGDLQMSYSVIEQQVIVLKNNFFSHQRILKELIKRQERILTRYKSIHQAEVEKNVDEILDEIIKGA